MSHKEFILAYEHGNIGCSVSTWTTWWLFIRGKIRQKKLSSRLFFWSVSFPVVMTGSGFGFLNFRFFWAILEMAITLVLWTLAFFYWVAEYSRTSLGGLARAAGLYSTTPRIISESKSNRTAAKVLPLRRPASRMLIQPRAHVIGLYTLKLELTGRTKCQK
jgi:hypothetical protein